jgi:hypothetical protein
MLPLEEFNLNQRQCRRCQQAAKLLRRYGITPEQLAKMVAAQGGCCAICGNPFATTPHVDHCHRTGRNRGLLCFTCNIRLGWYEKWKEEVDGYLTATPED